MLKVVRAKLHAIRVTGADLNYHGSITLDPDHCTEVGIYPLEFVEIWNKHSGGTPVDLRYLRPAGLALLHSERRGGADLSGWR